MCLTKCVSSSCYMNSVMQVLFSLPEFATEFGGGAVDKFAGEPHPEDDLRLQLYVQRHA